MAKSTSSPATIASEESPSRSLPSPDAFERLRQQVQEQLKHFRARPVTPLACFELENQLQADLKEAGRQIFEEGSR